MLQFFRRLRLQLLTKNKLTDPTSISHPTVLSVRASKYLSYAIGEISLVELGILNAFQVYHYNDNIKDLNQNETNIDLLVNELQKNSLIIQELLGKVEKGCFATK